MTDTTLRAPAQTSNITTTIISLLTGAMIVGAAILSFAPYALS
ncbi:MAG TPA: hypothetical protein VGG48_02225 [Rhizomicrobium sp.]|jgi:hypothetical protein